MLPNTELTKGLQKKQLITTFSNIFFNILRMKIEYFMTTLTTNDCWYETEKMGADTKSCLYPFLIKIWLLIQFVTPSYIVKNIKKSTINSPTREDSKIGKTSHFLLLFIF